MKKRTFNLKDPETKKDVFGNATFRQFPTLLAFYQKFCEINRRHYKYKLDLLEDLDESSSDKVIEIFSKFNIFFDDRFLKIAKLRAHNVFVEKTNNKLIFTIPTHTVRQHYLGTILFISQINDKYVLKDFKRCLINMKFRPEYSQGRLLFDGNIFGTASSPNMEEKAFLSNYVTTPSYVDPQITEDYGIKEFIEKIKEAGNQQMISNKLFFRGVKNGAARNLLFKHYEGKKGFDIKDPFSQVDDRPNPLRRGMREDTGSYINFLDFPQYKYILDLQGGGGHAGRRYWLFHMNRVLFLPTDEVFKLFFDTWDNPPVPDVHFVSYQISNLSKTTELEDKLRWLENNPDDYERIRINCKEYAEKNLNYESLELFVKNSLELDYEDKGIL